MKMCLASLGLIAIVGLSPFSAWASVCQAPSPPRVQVLVLDPQPVISTSKSLKQINASAIGHGLVQKGKMAMGTTESETQSDMNIQFAWQERRAGSKVVTCVSVQSMKVRFGHSKLLVSLPREYGRGTCQYKVVHRHEMAHVEVNRGAVRKYAAILRSEIIQDLQRAGIQQTSTMSRGTKFFEKRLRAVMNDVTGRFNQEIKVLHGRIDAPNSAYAAQGACRSW